MKRNDVTFSSTITSDKLFNGNLLSLFKINFLIKECTGIKIFFYYFISLMDVRQYFIKKTDVNPEP